MSPKKIIFVCTGNTCRSPMAAAMAAPLFAEAGLTVEIFSAGVNAMPNQPASRHAITVMEEDGLCLLSHRAAIVSEDILDNAWLVLTMTDRHRAVLLSDYPKARDMVFTLSEYIGEAADIADPFGGDVEEYRTCAAQIKAMLLRVVEKIKQTN